MSWCCIYSYMFLGFLFMSSNIDYLTSVISSVTASQMHRLHRCWGSSMVLTSMLVGEKQIMAPLAFTGPLCP